VLVTTGWKSAEGPFPVGENWWVLSWEDVSEGEYIVESEYAPPYV
jgi:hypothetical protein